MPPVIDFSRYIDFTLPEQNRRMWGDVTKNIRQQQIDERDAALLQRQEARADEAWNYQKAGMEREDLAAKKKAAQAGLKRAAEMFNYLISNSQSQQDFDNAFQMMEGLGTRAWGPEITHDLLSEFPRQYSPEAQKQIESTLTGFLGGEQEPGKKIHSVIDTERGFMTINSDGSYSPILDPETGKPVKSRHAAVNLAKGIAKAKETGKREGAEPYEAAERGRDLAARYSKARSAYDSWVSEQQNSSKTIDEALALVSPFTAGVGSVLSILPGSKAKNLESKLNTIKAKVGFDKLQEMRDNSPTGGALGQVSERENELLQSTIAALNTDQSPEQLRKHLIRVKDELNGMTSRLKGAMDRDFAPLLQKEQSAASSPAPMQQQAPAPVQQQAPAPALEALKQRPELINDFVAKYGYRPEGY